MTIIETKIFTKLITKIMNDDEYQCLQEAIVSYPNIGSIIKNSSGLRKIRWALKDRGKSSGIRIIYYWITNNEQIYFLYVFPKNEQDNLTHAQTHTLRQIVERWEQ